VHHTPQCPHAAVAGPPCLVRESVLVAGCASAMLPVGFRGGAAKTEAANPAAQREASPTLGFAVDRIVFTAIVLTANTW
jgi:hypothetical protein